MYTVAPSEVIHWRSAPAVSMICAVQLLALDVAVGQVMAETPIWARLKTGLIRKISVVAWSTPVEPMSTSASPLPKTCFPLFCRVASIKPPQVSAEEGGVEQPLEPGYSQRAIARNRNRRFALALGTEQWRVGEGQAARRRARFSQNRGEGHEPDDGAQPSE